MSQTEPLVRCSICGKENPAGATICAYCGTRLGSAALAGGVEQPSPSNDLNDLRSQLGLTDTKKPTSPLKEPEPDFSYGPAEGKGAPDWLSDILQTPLPPAPLQEEIPDWLQDIEAPPSAVPAQPAPITDETPSWLEDLERPASSSASMPSLDLPDWLAEAPSAIPATPPTKEVPDWLNETDKPAMPVPPPPHPLEMPEEPDWLTRSSEEPAKPSADEIPDWLAEVEGLGSSKAPAPAVKPPAEEIPDWLQGIGGPEPPSALSVEPSSPVVSSSEGEADWLAQIGLSKPASAEPATPSLAPPSDEAPDWLRDLIPSAPSPAPPEKPPAHVTPEGGDWISALGLKPTSSETLPSPESSPPLPVTPAPDITSEPGGTSAPDWLGLIDFSEQPGPSLPIAGEDLLGLSADLAPPPILPDTEKVPEELFSAADISELLAEGIPEEKPADELPEAAPELLAQIGDLRFEAITGQPAGKAEATPETVGALKDVTGVIRPELLFDGVTLQTRSLVDGTVITKDQTRRIELVQKLLSHESEGVSVSGKRRRALPIVRWLVSIVVAAAIILPNMLGFALLAPSLAQPDSVRAIYQLIETLPPSGHVLVAFEYEPDTAGEMQILAQALLEHLAKRPDLTVYAVSTRITGPAMAQSAFEQVIPTYIDDDEPGGRWINLGYISGEANGVSALTVGSSPGVPSPLAFDYLGRSTGITATRLTELSPDLIIVLASRTDDLRVWIEQAGRPTGLPILAAMSASSAPTAYPYQQTGQLAGVLSGVNEAIAYRTASGNNPAPSMMAIWNAQASGALVAALAIALGGVIYGLATRREQQEQD
jgi:hypothetical protein